MSEFQLGLLSIGALAIVGVIVYNQVQERLARRQAERAFGSQHEDVLLDESTARREPTLEPAARTGDHEPEGSMQAMPDEALDYVISLTAERPLPLSAFFEYWGPLEHRLARRALASGSEDGSAWKSLGQGDPGAYRAFQIALQLVSRAGVAREGELIEFRAEVENLAAALGATVVAPELKRVMARARELDQFCADADIQVALNLVASDGEPFPAARLDSAVVAAGLERAADGAYALRDAEGGLLYTVTPVAGEIEGGIAKLGFYLDVPRVREVRKTYESMVRLASQLAAGLGGTLVDDNGRALDEKSLAAIGAELDTVRQTLERRGLPPGGPLALRLFS
jgi:hypothetical protein